MDSSHTQKQILAFSDIVTDDEAESTSVSSGSNYKVEVRPMRYINVEV